MLVVKHNFSMYFMTSLPPCSVTDLYFSPYGLSKCLKCNIQPVLRGTYVCVCIFASI